MNLTHAKEALKQYYGYDEFRPMQADIIQNVLDKKDCLVLMPTGGGKSICFQIPAIISPGVCLVISPLIALMKDQVEGLRENGVSAAFLNSSLNSSQQLAIEEECIKGNIKLLYVSPEKLVSQSFLPLLKQLPINLIAVDEAHCISQWGHDFRPEYTKMNFIKKQFPEIPLIALTATADKITRRDITTQLSLTDPTVFLDSFDRPNLSLMVLPGQKRYEMIRDFISERPDTSGIIYCTSRKSTESISNKLIKAGYKAAHYHAGLSSSERAHVQDEFINDNVPIICATVAFGMGIDKSNIRWVIHYNLPKNIESYYQEIGRAGRDGLPSETLLFYSFGDVMTMRNFIEEGDYKELKLAKLDRMLQYADSMICRRKILLSYFSEQLSENCNNCDVCKSPPKHFDGTIIAQKALSAVARLKQEAPSGLLIDVLRGSAKSEIIQKGYDKIKTYGAGSSMSYFAWQQYFLQLINMGLLEIAYDQNNALKLNPSSEEVLFKGKKVSLVELTSWKEKKEERKKQTKPKTKVQEYSEALFQHLRVLRRQLAQQQGIPPYRIFSDATLKDMAGKMPLTKSKMNQVSGVGEHKLQQFGDTFIDSIKEYIDEQNQTLEIRANGDPNIKPMGSTYQVSYAYYKKGLSVEEIARERKLNPSTVYGHLGILYNQGKDIDLLRLLEPGVIKRVKGQLPGMEEPYKAKLIFEGLNEQVSYDQIRLALSYLEAETKADKT